MVIMNEIVLRTGGNGEVLDITSEVRSLVRGSGLRVGSVVLFVPGSTGALTTIEFEPGAAADFREAMERIAPPGHAYKHHLRWGDDNGHAHVQAAVIGPSLTVPFVEGELTLGQWQQIVFVDFDTRPRTRKIVTQIAGE